MYINREKWTREISFGLLSFFLAYIFFYLTTHKRPPLTLTFAVGLIVLGVVTYLVLKQAKWALLLIFLFMPFYPFIRIQVIRFEIVGAFVMFIVSRWPEFLMFLALLGRKVGGLRRILYSAPILDFLIVCYILLGVAYFVERVVVGKWMMGLWGLKEQFLFFTYYFLVRFIPFGKEDIKRYLFISAIIAAAIAAFGAVQAQFFGPDFLKTLGYGIDLRGSGYTMLPQTYMRNLPGGISFVRAISILQDALSLGGYLMIFLLVLQPSYFLPEEKKNRGWKHFQYILMLLGLLYTTTRSAWIGTAAGTLLLAWRRKKFLVTCAIFLFLGIIFLLLLFSVPGGKEWLISSVVTGKEESQQLHFAKYGWQFQKMIEHPLGLGLGMTGRVGTRFKAQVTGGFNTECWYLQVGTQMGIAGFCLYIAIVLETLRALFMLGQRLRDPFLKDLANGILAAYLGCSLFGIFLNVWSCHLMPIFMHLFVGMALFHFPLWDQAFEEDRSIREAPSGSTGTAVSGPGWPGRSTR